jgi:hypothetical protein
MPRVAFDMDDTITANPKFFSFLSHAIKKAGGAVFVISSRTDIPEARQATYEELREYNIAFDDMILIPDMQVAAEMCPIKELNAYQKYIWQKIRFCEQWDVSVYFDDEEAVVELFRQYAPKIQVFKAIKKPTRPCRSDGYNRDDL